jgi:histidyl-tRNA synthetase
MSELQTIDRKIGNYEEIKSELASAKDVVSKLTEQLNAAEAEVITSLLDLAEQTGAEKTRVTVNGRNYSVTVKSYYHIPKERCDQAFPTLRAFGLGHLIQEKVDDRSLTNELNAIAEQNGGLLPAEYDDIGMTSYDKPRLSSTRA